jgi:glutamate-1-semialdehyde aminotransferase
VSGFRPETKEIVYPIVVKRSEGCKLSDLDGNEYIDLTCGFGSNFFGYGPSFIRDAVAAQLREGYEIGPQHPLAGEVAARISRFTGMPRVVFCNTGSEAVLGALRVARTATGRHAVALFSGSCHGIVDEVIVRGGKNGRPLPAAAGIPPGAVENLLLLDYGAAESLQILRERAGDLAAVLVEPVQGRHPYLQPRDFLHEVRRITERTGTALVFDEVITGFRLHAGGAQAWFGVRSDLATYGKVVGGGLPIGVIAGRERFPDALDGGFWSFGDDSIPEAGITYFAGTFVRHPLALAAAQAVLTHLERSGQRLYDDLNARAARLAGQLNSWFAEAAAPLRLESCGSLLKVAYTRDVPFGELHYTLLRLRGVHAWDARPCFLTTAHRDEDVARVVQALQEAVCELQAAGFYPPPPTPVANPCRRSQAVPVAEARLGKDPPDRPAVQRLRPPAMRRITPTGPRILAQAPRRRASRPPAPDGPAAPAGPNLPGRPI